MVQGRNGIKLAKIHSSQLPTPWTVAVTSVPNAVHQGRQFERGGKVCKEEEGAREKKVCEKMCYSSKKRVRRIRIRQGPSPATKKNSVKVI